MVPKTFYQLKLAGSRYKGSVLVHWVPGAGAGASTKIKYEIIEKVNKI